MPGKDGTGPMGQGSRMGRGKGGGNFQGAGPGGNCVCPACGEKMPHQAGTPCAAINCPKCGIRMIRE